MLKWNCLLEIKYFIRARLENANSQMTNLSKHFGIEVTESLAFLHSFHKMESPDFEQIEYSVNYTILCL